MKPRFDWGFWAAVTLPLVVIGFIGGFLAGAVYYGGLF